MRDKTIIERRNREIKNKFAVYEKQYPKWKTEYLIKKIADEFYLAPRTVENILTDRV